MNFEEMGREECLRLHGELSDESGRIKAQLEQARANVVARGEYSDPDWYVRATVAQRITARKLQRVQLRLSVLKREEKAHNIAAVFEANKARGVAAREMGSVVPVATIPAGHIAFLHAFYRQAKATMDPGDFRDMCNEAQEVGAQNCDKCETAREALVVLDVSK